MRKLETTADLLAGSDERFRGIVLRHLLDVYHQGRFDEINSRILDISSASKWERHRSRSA